jgi:hypothetical protein
MSSKLHTITEEQQNIIFLQDYQNDHDMVIFNQRQEEFLKTWDFNSNPSKYAKQVTGWAKKNILLDIWYQWVAYEEANGERVFGLPVSETLANMTRIDQVTAFADYLKSYLESVNKKLEEEETKEKTNV